MCQQLSTCHTHDSPYFRELVDWLISSTLFGANFGCCLHVVQCHVHMSIPYNIVLIRSSFIISFLMGPRYVQRIHELNRTCDSRIPSKLYARGPVKQLFRRVVSSTKTYICMFLDKWANLFSFSSIYPMEIRSRAVFCRVVSTLASIKKENSN